MDLSMFPLSQILLRECSGTAVLLGIRANLRMDQHRPHVRCAPLQIRAKELSNSGHGSLKGSCNLFLISLAFAALLSWAILGRPGHGS